MTSAAGYLRRTRRSLRGRSPLVRRTDRVEARLFSLLVAAMLLMIPVAAIVVANVQNTQVAMAQQQLAERTMVTATLDADPVVADSGWGEFSYIAPSTAPATWEFRGVSHHGDVQITGTEGAGDEVQVWVDRAGAMTLQPMSVSAAEFSSVLAGVAVYMFALVTACGLFALAHWGVERARSREWSRDIEAFLGSTSSH
ncbi:MULTISPECIES: Rv1733c family protein [unclassified Rhodococcus (in: high G+C Gram-positive bacteria)]|uniref:Rv1733c family protein n=1 Tax=Rhodococcus sp. SJ-3 TaxID=3454628 RepID=UPI002D9FB823|nr:hypothetical protein [Rhodococcus sp. (in: high G+C Gram-positive bacteria)]